MRPVTHHSLWRAAEMCRYMRCPPHRHTSELPQSGVNWCPNDDNNYSARCSQSVGSECFASRFGLSERGQRFRSAVSWSEALRPACHLIWCGRSLRLTSSLVRAISDCTTKSSSPCATCCNCFVLCLQGVTSFTHAPRARADGGRLRAPGLVPESAAGGRQSVGD